MRTPLLLALLLLTGAADDPPPTPLEREMLAGINRVRADPAGYAAELRDYREAFDGKVVKLRGRPGLMTIEGTAAVDDAIAFLARQQPLPPFAQSDLLGLAARDLARAQGPTGAVGHRGPDGSMPGDRVKRRGGEIFVGETVSYGPEYADSMVRLLVVDDGVRDRGHRKIMFSNHYRFAGVGCAEHDRYGHMCAVDYGVTANGGPLIPPER